MELLVNILLVSASGYLLGSIPTSFILGKVLKGVDLREFGSGNLGAANTFRVLGAKAAVPVLIIDIGKGFLAVKAVSLFGIDNSTLIALAAFLAVLGHNYSIFVRFSGGKGVGTTTGVFLAIAPVAVAICLIVWLVILLLTRIVSLASMSAAVFLPVSLILMRFLFGYKTGMVIIALSVIVAIAVIYKHRSNIKRLKLGTEKRIF
ncbi:MAG TPA: glycerol-3-phosphate 1-O-acyltransferase PlsY [Candidatus Krumholzibacteriaceae bacterium]|nr:glycerol-3-phosphate 1-O-acyltransferase PlsY [Candidatus Krumholzibacteriaceae bacterium]